jgi:hypothetical protein
MSTETGAIGGATSASATPSRWLPTLANEVAHVRMYRRLDLAQPVAILQVVPYSAIALRTRVPSERSRFHG